MREFEVAIGRAAVAKSDDITFKIGKDEITAKAPTVGQLALFMNGGQGTVMASMGSMLKFISDVVDDKSWRKIENHLRDGLDMAVIQEVVNFLIGEWSGRPTKPSDDSTPTQPDTGHKSTAKRRGAAA